jgi:hypothetical protein
MTAPNFARLDADRPEVSRLMIAMLQAREALSRRSWSHPLEYAGSVHSRHSVISKKMSPSQYYGQCKVQ